MEKNIINHDNVYFGPSHQVKTETSERENPQHLLAALHGLRISHRLYYVERQPTCSFSHLSLSVSVRPPTGVCIDSQRPVCFRRPSLERSKTVPDKLARRVCNSNVSALRFACMPSTRNDETNPPDRAPHGHLSATLFGFSFGVSTTVNITRGIAKMEKLAATTFGRG